VGEIAIVLVVVVVIVGRWSNRRNDDDDNDNDGMIVASFVVHKHRLIIGWIDRCLNGIIDIFVVIDQASERW